MGGIEAEGGHLTSDSSSSSSHLNTLRSCLATKSWFGFDLDDTLHEFRKASGFASSSVFEAICAAEQSGAEESGGVSGDALRASYKDILQSKTANAFADGRTSRDYRRERFSCLLQSHNLEISDAKLDRLLDVYQVNLQAGLALKPGALQFLKKLKSLGKKIIVVTEGPRDAQEWTVHELGLRPYIDVLVTTNEVGKSKVDGLFSVVLKKYRIRPADMVYIGDNEARDVRPAQAEGITAVLYDEKRDCRFDENLNGFRVNSFARLEGLLRSTSSTF
ncbi:HAD-like protein [Xylona heveae TC161]|uniref:HAD-like protein n=1 Tax=Xylona heveae (strain CBS 132557 / TC161) TaxID=1328760 RepID=A0A164ZJE8_XYLHT|nr:HAD-like protein [Xylona heveae TC161]KZF19173.1 HAD-like protein [Xylona heveae TC161]